MAAQSKPPAKAGVLIDVARVVAVGRNREGGAVLRVQDTKGRLVAIRLRRQQFRTLASGVLGLAEGFEGRRGGGGWPDPTPPDRAGM